MVSYVLYKQIVGSSLKEKSYMQIYYSPLSSLKQNREPKANPVSQPLPQNKTNVGFASNPMPASENIRGYYLSGIGRKKQVSFGLSLDENLKTWGATVNNDGAKFKVWQRWAQKSFVQAVPADSPDPTETDKTLPDYKKEYPWHFDAEKIKFNVRNNETGEVSVLQNKRDQVIDLNKNTITIPEDKAGEIWELKKTTDDGVFESDRIPEIKPGYKYRYIFINSDGCINYRHDPNSYRLDNVNSWSTVVDHDTFDWEKQKRTPDPNNSNILKAPNTKAFSYRHDRGNASQINLEEVHIGTLSKKGDYESAKRYVDKLIKDHPATTHIELMPLETTYSANWGYDGIGTGKFAPTVHYKSADPDALKDFIKYTQDKGLGVIIDMVPNHYSHDFANNLEPFGPYESFNEAEKKQAPWGKIYNFEGPENTKIRHFVTRMALNWLVNYNANGLRFDMTKYMKSRNALKQMSQEIRYHVPDAILIAEDGEDCDGTHCDYAITKPLSGKDACSGKSIEEHNAEIEKTCNNQSSLENIGMDSQWGFHLQHTLFALITGKNYPMNAKYIPNIYKFEAMFKDPQAKTNVIYPMSHDEKGNLDGTNLITKVLTDRLDMFSRIQNKGNVGVLAAQATQNMVEAYYYDGFCDANVNDKTANKKWNEYQKNITYKEKEFDLDGKRSYSDKTIVVNNPVSLKEFKEKLDYARTCHKLAIGTVYAFPAPKMFQQGDRYGAIEPFYFFRNEQPGYDKKKVYDIIRAEKGYDHMPENDPNVKNTFNAFNRSKLRRDKAPEKLEQEYQMMEAFEKKLGQLVQENPALKVHKNDEAHLQTFVYNHSEDNILQVMRKDGNGNNIIALMNFTDKEYKEFKLKNTDGKWIEEINSDDKAYGGTGNFVTKGIINSDKDGNVQVKIPKKGFLIFKQV